MSSHTERIPWWELIEWLRAQGKSSRVSLEFEAGQHGCYCYMEVPGEPESDEEQWLEANGDNMQDVVEYVTTMLLTGSAGPDKQSVALAMAELAREMGRAK